MTREELIEATLSAHRELRADGTIADAPSWHDLDAAGRTQAHAEAISLRALEAALDPHELSTTARAILARIGGRR